MIAEPSIGLIARLSAGAVCERRASLELKKIMDGSAEVSQKQGPFCESADRCLALEQELVVFATS